MKSWLENCINVDRRWIVKEGQMTQMCHGVIWDTKKLSWPNAHKGPNQQLLSDVSWEWSWGEGRRNSFNAFKLENSFATLEEVQKQNWDSFKKQWSLSNFL